MSPAPDPAEMLAEMSACAYRLGMAFGTEAERAEGKRRLDCLELFERCFFGVRVAIGLRLRLFQAAARERAEPSRQSPRERETSDSREPTLAPAFAYERDRDRERETDSLPILLNTLEGVCADAQALPGPKPSALPTLRELLTRVGGAPAPNAKPQAAPGPAKTSPRSPPPGGGGLKSRLAGSGAALTSTFTPPPRGPPGGAFAQAPRRSTGPPRP